MANQQVFQAYPQNKGTLVPGQTISVNNYTVQVERYLSQGGFAHVYLVRTPTPVYNTTHHVLKRIAVANESMLTEVKKEVDIMRLLKGHPNIVHLIDAAWHKLPNGTFEVFILMEYCPGGGIIDMMNRRLRERLTEAEILQIFVDVCEGVAYMHNSRPPLLHRDLKVENILQSSPTSFKLCDFGSATTVPNPPTNMQEIRALEADLNRHTTLQYRAPEMVDVYSKRPVNEKSDVWALGVLLYKLCYYTTPFEEHGPLAILNVQYRIPPYPVYSQDMNMLIGSMLREHGAQRPTVFEILNHVHRLRGTKSKFTYNVPVPPPLLARPHVPPKSPSNPLEDVITYRTAPTQPAMSLYDPKVPSNPPPVNQGIQAREKVLEAIAPMRRGRPVITQSSSRSSSPQKSGHAHQKSRDKVPDWLDRGFENEKDKIWKSATDRSAAQGGTSTSTDDAWNLKDLDKPSRTDGKDKAIGFGDDFGEKLWNSSDPNQNAPVPPKLSPRPAQTKLNDIPIPITPTPLAYTGSHMIRPKADRLMQNREKDAFEGLGLTSSAPKNAPTLGEARKLRTGLATMTASFSQRDAGRPNAISASARPPPSPQPNYLSPTSMQTQSLSPMPTTGSGSSIFRHSQHSPSVPSPSPSINADGHAESRFPSVEELDAQFSPPPVNALYPASVNDASSSYLPSMSRNALSNRPPPYQPSTRPTNLEPGANLLRPSAPPTTSHSIDGVRSLQVTGTAMRDSKENRRFDDDQGRKTSTISRDENPSGLVPVKPVAIRKKRSSIIPPINVSEKESPVAPLTENLEPPKLPRRPVATIQPRDWLTGDDLDDMKPQPPVVSDGAVLRDSPRKRASFIETNEFTIPAPSSATQDIIVPPPTKDEPPSADLSPTVSNFKRAFPPIEIDTNQSHNKYPNGVTDNWSAVATRGKTNDADSSSGDEGPEDAKSTRPITKKREAARAKGRQSSVHELVSQYGGRIQSTSTVTKDMEDRDKEQKDRDRLKEKEKERAPLNYSVGDYKPHRSRPSGVGLPPSTLASDVQPSLLTAQQTSLAPTLTAKVHSVPLNDKPVPPPVSKKPSTSAPAKSRPQSMFIFPSKSTDSTTSPTTNLMPPQESKPRATRRTSISDMVQLYEAIGNSTGVPAGPPSPIHRPVSTKASMGSSESGRPYKPFPEHTKPKSITSTVSLTSDSRATEEPSKSKAVVNEPIRSTATLTRTPTKIQRKPTVDVDKSKPIRSSSPDRTTPRTRRMSSKAEPTLRAATHSRSETTTSVTIGATKTTTLSEPWISNSPRKPPISLNEEGPSKPDERPPSPDRPYQGVGRLIDQWQKKSAESEQSRPVGKLMLKRPTAIRNDDR